MKDTRILIVDDSPFQIALLSDVLEEQGFEVVGQAMSLEEVKSEVKRTKPDLVTMDLTIPGTDGFECTKAVHDIDSNIKVIVVSSMMDEELINKAKKLGISGFIQKPVDTEELTLLINRVMADEDLFCELESLYNEYKEKFDNLSTKDFVTGHAAFGYLCRDFRLQQKSVENLFAEGEPTPKQLEQLVTFCKENNIKTVFSESLASPKVSETLAKEVGAEVVPILTLESNEDDKSYVEAMRYNLEEIYKCLSQE